MCQAKYVKHYLIYYVRVYSTHVTRHDKDLGLIYSDKDRKKVNNLNSYGKIFQNLNDALISTLIYSFSDHLLKHLLFARLWAR